MFERWHGEPLSRPVEQLEPLELGHSVLDLEIQVQLVLRSEPVLDATVEILLSERRTCHQEQEIGEGRLLELLILSRTNERVEDAAVGDIAEIEVVRDLLLVLQ